MTGKSLNKTVQKFFLIKVGQILKISLKKLIKAFNSDPFKLSQCN